MRIKCNKVVSQTTKEDLGDASPWLKKGKEYVVFAMRWNSKFGMEVLIQSEHRNEPGFFLIEGFEIVTQKVPSTWITTTYLYGDQVIVSMQPQSWMYESFYDELEEEKTEAVMLFNKEVEIIIREES